MKNRDLVATAFGAVISVASCGGQSTADTPQSGDSDAAVATLSDDLSVATVDINQAVDVSLVADGAPITANAPVIAGRPGLVRVGIVMPRRRAKGRKLDAELHLQVGPTEVAILRDSESVVASSTLDNISSTFNFAVGADQLTADTTCSVVIRDPALSGDPSTSSVSFPNDGSTIAFGAQASSGTMKIKVVPIDYRFSTASSVGDGGTPLGGGVAGLLPDTSAAQIQRYHDTLYKMYPVAGVEISVRESFVWDQEVTADGTGWDALTMGVMGLRAQDNAPDDVFYVGAFVTTHSLSEFCNAGCVLGVAQLATAADVSARMAVIAGYTGDEAANTLNQELGHALGRNHADCGGADAPDRKFPYPNAGIGVWGYDLLAQQSIDPNSDVFDFMGYCQPIWISDYTYSAIFKRLALVDIQKREVRPAARRYRSVYVGRNGSLRWGSEVELNSDPGGENIEVQQLSDVGEIHRVSGHFYKQDTTGGGFVLVPDVDPKSSRLRISVMNRTLEVARP